MLDMHFPSADLQFNESPQHGEFFSREKSVDNQIMPAHVTCVTSLLSWPEPADNRVICSRFHENNFLPGCKDSSNDVKLSCSLPSNYVKEEEEESATSSNLRACSSNRQHDFTEAAEAGTIKRKFSPSALTQFGQDLRLRNVADDDSFDDSFPVCRGCSKVIQERYILRIGDTSWHENCTKCVICRIKLDSMSSCYVREGNVYCKADYRKKSMECAGCGVAIEQNERVRRVMMSSYAYHKECFVCATCSNVLETGHLYHFVGVEDDYLKKCLQCHKCWNDSKATVQSTSTSNLMATSPGVSSDITDSLCSPKSSPCILSIKSEDDNILTSDDQVTLENINLMKDETEEEQSKRSCDEGGHTKDIKRVKRPRTILDAAQRILFKQAFESSSKPSRKMREQLAKDTGLTVRVVQVWFQNQRAKVKKLAKRKEGQEVSINEREKFEFQHYNSFVHMPGHMLPGADGMMYPIYQQFHNQHQMALQSQTPLECLRTNWESSTYEGMQMIPEHYPNLINCYQEETRWSGGIAETDGGEKTKNCADTRKAIGQASIYHGNMLTHEIVNSCHFVDTHPTKSLSNVTSNASISSTSDQTSPNDGLFTAQNNFCKV